MGRMCDGKKRFDTYGKAIQGALKYSWNTGNGVRVYECPICHGFHLTTHSKDGKSLKNEFAKEQERSNE